MLKTQRYDHAAWSEDATKLLPPIVGDDRRLLRQARGAACDASLRARARERESRNGGASDVTPVARQRACAGADFFTTGA
jgi:hypothetical protein